ncbi:MAG: hypothetical protein WBE26_07750 [Phycisphaerae bacterium]
MGPDKRVGMAGQYSYHRLLENRIMSRLASYTTFVVCGLLPSLSLAGQLPERFTLGRYIPGDVWLYAHAVHNPERDWLDKEWQEVLDALKASGIDRDLISLVMAAVGDEDRAETEATLEKWMALIAQVRWSDMWAKELAFAERMTKGALGPEYLALMRGKPGTAEGNTAGLVAILKEVTSLSEKTRFAERDVSGVTVWSLGQCKPEVPEPVPGIYLFRKGDTIGLGLGLAHEPFTDVIHLMTGESDSPAIVATPRFREALAEVKTPEDSVLFFDGKQLFRDIRGLMQLAARDAEASGDNKDVKVVHLIWRILDLCDVWDYSVVSVETEGRRELTHTFARIQPDKRESPLLCAFFGRKPFERFDQFIPVDATGFHVNGFIDLESLYKLVIDFVEQNVPDGAEYIARWNGLLALVGFDPQRDLFSWFSGEMVSVTLPPEVVTPMSNSDWMVAFRVKNGALASKKIDAAMDFINCKLQAHGQMLIVTPAPVNAEGFRQITHPMVMAFLRPVIGVKDEWLMIGSSPATINKCLAVAAGKAPSIRHNERFKREGLIPEGPVASCSFKDMSNLGEELGMAVGMVGMVGGMMSGIIQDSDADEVKPILQKLMAMLMKLGPVLQKIDFYSSDSSVTTYDGALTLRTERVITYKPPSSAIKAASRSVNSME